MRYSNTAITELSAKYRSILKKCALLNAAILLTTAVALPAGADFDPVTGAYIVTENGSLDEIISSGSIDANGLAVKAFNSTSASGYTTSLTTPTINISATGEFSDSTHGPRGVEAWYGANVTFGDLLKTSTIHVNGVQRGLSIYDPDTVVNINASEKVDVSSDYLAALVTDTSVLNVESKDVSLTATEPGSIGLYVLNEGQANITASNEIMVNALGDAITAWTGIDTQDKYIANSGGKINIETGNLTVNAGGTGVGANYSKSNVTINATGDVNITASGTDDTRAIHAGNAYTYEGVAKEDTSYVSINAQNINLTADKIAISAMSNGYVELEGNTTIKAKDAILTRGNATTNINTSGNNTIKIDGDVVFSYYEGTPGNSASLIDAYVNINLSDKDSYWNGNTYAEWNVTPADLSKLDVTKATLNLSNGATWNATTIKDIDSNTDGQRYVALNNLTVDNGTINIADTTRGIMVDNSVMKDATITGGPFNVANSMNVSGQLDIAESSIVGTAGATIKFTDTTTLSARLKSSASILGTVTGLDKVTVADLVVENGLSDGSYKLMETGNANFAGITAVNSLYSFNQGDNFGEIKITKKSTDEIVENLVTEGATAQEAATISAIADATVDHPVLNKITEAVQTGDVKTAAKAAQDLAPTTSQAALGISKDVQSLLTNAATARMAALAGRSGGDVFKGGSMWVQGLFNHTKQDSTSHNEGFKANSKGIAFGIDGKLNDAVTVGLGYGYTRTDADAGNRDIDVDGNNVFAYAEYSPDAWYVNGVLNFGYGRYTEKKSPLGHTMKSKYDVYTYGANVMTGYAFDSGLTPEGGLRYLLVDQKSYTDGVEKISTKNNDVLTAVLGAKYGYKVKAKDWMFTPNVRLAATYDLMSDSSKAVSSITGGSSYQITGERLHRLGFEAGVGVTSTWNNWDFTLSYDGGFRKDYQSHTGTLKAKYHF